MYYPPYEAAA
jgi:beta-glucosidase-like glycosyl hydrolase